MKSLIFGLLLCTRITSIGAQVLSADHQMNFLLSKAYPAYDGPNCWNSVLFSKGISPGIYYSDGEIEFWLQSPLCEEVKKPQKGDVVDISRLSDSGQDYSSTHSYIYQSVNTGFTKNGPSKDEPYQLTSLENINNYYELTDSKCMNKSRAEGLGLKCELVSTVYRCRNIDTLIPLLHEQIYYKTLVKITDRLNAKIFLSSVMLNIDEKQLQEIRNLATKSIHVPTFDSLPQSLKTKIRKHFEIPVGDEYDTDEFRNYITEIVYLNSYPLQRSATAGSPVGNLINSFRSQLPYTNLNQNEFYYWAHILNTARNIRTQLKDLK